jgi:hypothetical protein
MQTSIGDSFWCHLLREPSRNPGSTNALPQQRALVARVSRPWLAVVVSTKGQDVGTHRGPSVSILIFWSTAIIAVIILKPRLVHGQRGGVRIVFVLDESPSMYSHRRPVLYCLAAHTTSNDFTLGPWSEGRPLSIVFHADRGRRIAEVVGRSMKYYLLVSPAQTWEVQISLRKGDKPRKYHLQPEHISTRICPETPSSRPTRPENPSTYCSGTPSSRPI